jgi:hypothetical protein
MSGKALRLFLVMGMLGIVVCCLVHTSQALAKGTQRVGLVVKFADGSVFTDCIDYTGPGMTGEDVLDASDLPIVKDTSYGLGAAICKIGQDGCNYPQKHCFCKCQGATCEYWAYYHLDQQAGEWVYSGMGASWNTVEAGDVEGWAWGSGTAEDSEVEPPLVTFEELCSPPTATPTRTPKPSPPEVEFTADPEDIVAGGCSTVHWVVEDANVVAFEGQGVGTDDARYVCPDETHTYELLVLNEAGEFDYEVTVRVSQPTSTPSRAPSPTLAPTATPRTASAPATATSVPTQGRQTPSPSPTSTAPAPATPTSRPTLIAMAATPTVSTSQEEPTVQLQGLANPEHPTATPLAAKAGEQSIGLQRILLLLGVGAGTFGFGAIAFVIMLVLLMGIYFRARSRF